MEQILVPKKIIWIRWNITLQITEQVTGTMVIQNERLKILEHKFNSRGTKNGHKGKITKSGIKITNTCGNKENINNEEIHDNKIKNKIEIMTKRNNNNDKKK
jgi:hypothetical protein